MNLYLGRALQVGLPLLAALVLSALIFAASGYDVAEVVAGVLEGAVTGQGSIAQTLRWTVPILLIALGFMITFRSGEFNIGAQGQLMMGGIGTAAVALLVPGPALLVLPLAIAAGVIMGALWSAIAGVLKLRFGTDEVISTLMLNFIAVLMVQWVTTGPLKDDAVRGDSASTVKVADELRLASGAGMSWTMAVLVVLAVLAAWAIAERTAFGRKSLMVGRNPLASAWQGLQVGRLRMSTYLISGAFVGLAGALEVLGPTGRLITGATPTLGFTGIMVAVVGLVRVPGIILAALFFGALQAAILFLPIVSDLPISGLHVFEGLIGLLVTARFLRKR